MKATLPLSGFLTDAGMFFSAYVRESLTDLGSSLSNLNSG
jgi:hypothetical protein